MERRAAAAPLSTYLFFTSGVAVALPVFLWILYIFLCASYPLLIVPAALLTVAVAGVYFWAPASYELEGRTLTIRSGLGARRFEGVKSYSPLSRSTMPGMGLWHNGGLFGVRGVYWSRALGWYRAYVTNPQHLILVELEGGKKIVISPENAQDWDSEKDASGNDSFVTNLPIDAAFDLNLQIMDRDKPLF